MKSIPLLRSHNFMSVAGTALAMLTCFHVTAANLYQPGTNSSLIADRRANAVGDIVSILVYENSTARNATDTSADARMSLKAHLERSDFSREHVYAIGSGNSREGGGSTQRSGNVLAQLSVNVVGITENGDLLLSGEQTINVNKEITRIRVTGRVRPSDIEHGNIVQSSRIADARIDYLGEGDLARRSRPGLISWLLSLFRPW